ncbi:MAG: hypothetical protein ACKVW3_13365 [Phycisphaerales bacterium]
MPSSRAWSNALSDPSWLQRASVLKSESHTTVCRTTFLGLGVVVKSFVLTTPIARLKSFLRLSRAWRHQRGADRLRRVGIPTAPCLAIVRANGFEYLIMPALPGKTVLQHLADDDLSPRQQHSLARALGRQLARLTAAHLSNRDHKPSNLIVTSWRDSEPELAVIDSVAIHRRRDIHRMLFALLVEPVGTGLCPRRTILMRSLTVVIDATQPHLTRPDRRSLRRAWWLQLSDTLASHGDPRPQTSPLVSSENPPRDPA